MAMYGLATIPLIRKLNGICKQIWYVDDSAACGSIDQLRIWWNQLSAEGPAFGYFVNASKTWLVTKDNHLENATNIFAGSGVNITSDGRPYLGAAIGFEKFVEEYVKSKVESWMSNTTLLSEIAKSQPQAAFSALTHGLLSKWTYFSRVVPNISHLLEPLNNIIQSNLIPLTGRPPLNDLECSLFALPVRLGGLGIRLPSKNADREHISVTSMLRDHIPDQCQDYSHVICDQINKANISKQNSERCKEEADRICAQLPTNLQKAMKLAMEKGASTWLTVLPFAEHGFTLHKSAFQDALALRYGWTPSKLPSKCECGHDFSVDHALSCAKWVPDP